MCTKLIANQTIALFKYEPIGKYFCTLFFYPINLMIICEIVSFRGAKQIKCVILKCNLLSLNENVHKCIKSKLKSLKSCSPLKKLLSISLRPIILFCRSGSCPSKYQMSVHGGLILRLIHQPITDISLW